MKTDLVNMATVTLEPLHIDTSYGGSAVAVYVQEQPSCPDNDGLLISSTTTPDRNNRLHFGGEGHRLNGSDVQRPRSSLHHSEQGQQQVRLERSVSKQSMSELDNAGQRSRSGSHRNGLQQQIHVDERGSRTSVDRQIQDRLNQKSKTGSYKSESVQSVADVQGSATNLQRLVDRGQRLNDLDQRSRSSNFKSQHDHFQDVTRARSSSLSRRSVAEAEKNITVRSRSGSRVDVRNADLTSRPVSRMSPVAFSVVSEEIENGDCLDRLSIISEKNEKLSETGWFQMVPEPDADGLRRNSRSSRQGTKIKHSYHEYCGGGACFETSERKGIKFDPLHDKCGFGVCLVQGNVASRPPLHPETVVSKNGMKNRLHDQMPERLWSDYSERRIQAEKDIGVSELANSFITEGQRKDSPTKLPQQSVFESMSRYNHDEIEKVKKRLDFDDHGQSLGSKIVLEPNISISHSDIESSRSKSKKVRSKKNGSQNGCDKGIDFEDNLKPKGKKNHENGKSVDEYRKNGKTLYENDRDVRNGRTSVQSGREEPEKDQTHESYRSCKNMVENGRDLRNGKAYGYDDGHRLDSEIENVHTYDRQGTGNRDFDHIERPFVQNSKMAHCSRYGYPEDERQRDVILCAKNGMNFADMQNKSNNDQNGSAANYARGNGARNETVVIETKSRSERNCFEPYINMHSTNGAHSYKRLDLDLEREFSNGSRQDKRNNVTFDKIDVDKEFGYRSNQANSNSREYEVYTVHGQQNNVERNSYKVEKNGNGSVGSYVELPESKTVDFQRESPKPYQPSDGVYKLDNRYNEMSHHKCEESRGQAYQKTSAPHVRNDEPYQKHSNTDFGKLDVMFKHIKNDQFKMVLVADELGKKDNSDRKLNDYRAVENREVNDHRVVENKHRNNCRSVDESSMRDERILILENNNQVMAKIFSRVLCI